MRKNTKELAFSLVDIFEDLLDEKNLEIPCADKDEEEERHEGENAAKIYGTEYGNLLDKVEMILEKWAEKADD